MNEPTQGFTMVKPNLYEYNPGEDSRRVYLFTARQMKIFSGATEHQRRDMIRRKKEKGEYRDAQTT